jgi:predicted AlkP superfamily phosphohydrolase/phosphomutase
MRWLAALVLGCVALVATGAERRMVVLGVDGMDPTLLRRFMAEGATPALAALAASGGLGELGTTIPPQSPVAWSTFITGLDPGGHGLFDFVALDRATLTPYLSASRVTRSGFAPLPLGRWQLPLGVERTVLLRQGRAFWEYLDAAGIPARLFQVPANYPPVAAGESLAGMGTPDLRGTAGTFFYYTNAPGVAHGPRPGGEVRPLQGGRGRWTALLDGPPNTLRAGSPWTQVELRLTADARAPVALVEIGAARALLNVGEWSGWLPVEFSLLPGLVRVKGMVRVYLQRLGPAPALYVSPVNIDPAEPAQAIAHPAAYARELVEHAGLFYTEEMPEDTRVLSAGLFTPQEFLGQAGLVMDERRRLWRHELEVFRRAPGNRFLFFYLSTLDQLNHMLARESDPALPGHDPATPPAVLQALRTAYSEVDALVAEARAALGEGTTLIVMSDHGFAPFLRQAHLNAWLEAQGYLVRRDTARSDADWLAGIDWSRTRAFGLGLNALYINTRGRERDGIVEPSERAALAREIATRLAGWRDPANGAAVVTQAVLREDVYHGAHVAQAPDVIVGYARGYRASWATSTGQVAGTLLEDNREAWSGDHCMDARAVPGVIVANRPLAATPGELRDLPVTILTHFGVVVPDAMTGRNLLR